MKVGIGYREEVWQVDKWTRKEWSVEIEGQ